MSYSEHRKLRLLQSTRLNPLAKANSTSRSLLSATPILTPILSVRSLKTDLPGITPRPTTIDLVLGPTAVQEREARVAPRSPSTMAPAAIEAIEEGGTIIGVEA